MASKTAAPAPAKKPAPAKRPAAERRPPRRTLTVLDSGLEGEAALALASDFADDVDPDLVERELNAAMRVASPSLRPEIGTDADHEALLQRLRAAESRAAAAEARVAKLESALSRQPGGAAPSPDGTAELRRLQSDARSLNKQAEAAQAKVRSLEAKILRLQSGVRYRTGETVIAGFKSFGGFIRLPRELWNIFEEHKKRTRKTADPNDPLATAIARFHQERTGVRIESHAEAIATALPKDQHAEIIALLKSDDPAQGFREIISRLSGHPDVPPNAVDQLDRVEAVLRCGRDGISLPARARAPAYAPEGRRTLYAVHMRGPFVRNGYVTRTRLILDALRQAGFEPEAVTRLGFPTDLAAFAHVSLPVEDKFEDHLFYALNDEFGGLQRRGIDDYMLAYASRLETLAHQQRPRLIHAASNFVNGLAAIMAARNLGIPSIYEVRGVWEITKASHASAYEQTERYRLERRLEEIAVREADRVLTISNALKTFVAEQGVPPEHIAVIPNGVNTDMLRPTAPDAALIDRLRLRDRVVIGYVGSVLPYEGLELMLEAVGKLSARGRKNISVVIVGDGPAKASLEQAAKRHGIGESCQFTGRIPWEEAVRYYSVIDIAPFPRLPIQVTELVPPLKPYEAMAFARPVVASDVNALAETIEDGKTGLLFKKGDAEALTAALERLIADPALRATIGAAGRAFVEAERSIPAIARRLAAVYEEVGVRPRQ